MLKPIIIAIDFDGTVVDHRFPDVGPDAPGALPVLRKIVEKGHKIILWTMRSGEAERRDPISVRDNGDGTYEVLDGNATSQAAMMAMWDEIPVLIQGQESGGMDSGTPA